MSGRPRGKAGRESRAPRPARGGGGAGGVGRGHGTCAPRPAARRGVALFKSAAPRPACSRRHLGPKPDPVSAGCASPSHTSPAQASLIRTMPVKGGTKCIKYLLFGFNFIFWVSERDRRTPLSGATWSPWGPCPTSGPPVTGTARVKSTPGGRRKGLLPPTACPLGPDTRGAGTFLGGSLKPSRQGPGRPLPTLFWGGVSVCSHSESQEYRKGRRQGEPEHPLLGTRGPGRGQRGSALRD